MKFYETFDYNTRKYYWWTQRDINGRCAEIRQNDKGLLVLYICDFYKSTHKTLQEAINESKKYVGEHIVGIY